MQIEVSVTQKSSTSLWSQVLKATELLQQDSKACEASSQRGTPVCVWRASLPASSNLPFPMALFAA